jgi:hypothetical protein
MVTCRSCNFAQISDPAVDDKKEVLVNEQKAV